MIKHIALRLSLLAAVAMLAALSGCEDEAKRKKTGRDAQEELPPPTPEEVAQKIISDALLDAPIPRKGTSLPPTVRRTMLDLLRREKTRLQGTEDGDKALAIVASKVVERVRQYERAELWEHVLTLTDAHLIFDPGSKRYNYTRDKALVELRKPRVTLGGLPEIDGRKTVILRFYLPMTNKTHSERMTLGEEMHGTRLLSVIGKDRGVRMEYLETGEVFEVYFSAAK